MNQLQSENLKLQLFAKLQEMLTKNQKVQK